MVEIAKMEPDSSKWGVNFPNQWATLQKTETNNIDTTYGGSSKFSWLERDPRQVILFAGYPFSKEYNDDRGHMNAVTDVRETKRLNLTGGDPKHTPATCYSCKSSNNPGLWDEMGMEAYDKMSFSEMTPNINNPIGCANCHEAGTMRLIVTNPALEEALEAQGKDWTTFTRQEMRTVVCANCHVEYYFEGDGKYLTFPWANGTRIDQIIAYYGGIGFKDWEYPEAGTPMLKAQHPEYEFFTAEQHPLQRRRLLRRLSHALRPRRRGQVLHPRCPQPAAQPRAGLRTVPHRYRSTSSAVSHHPGAGCRHQDQPPKTPSSMRSTPSRLPPPTRMRTPPCSTRRATCTARRSSCGTSSPPRTARASTTPNTP